MKTALERILKERLIWDGGTGSILQARGLKPGELPERWNLTHPKEIQQLACEYYSAGADIVNTNTFGLNALKFPGEVAEIAAAAVENVRIGMRLAGKTDGLR